MTGCGRLGVRKLLPPSLVGGRGVWVGPANEQLARGVGAARVCSMDREMTSAMYSAAIIMLAKRGAGCGHLESPRAAVTLDSPFCGDRITMEVNWTDGGIITEIAYTLCGCVLCQAAASAIGDHAAGMSLGAVAEAAESLRRMLGGEADEAPSQWPDLVVFKAVRGVKSRYDCVLLPFEALLSALGFKESFALDGVSPHIHRSWL